MSGPLVPYLALLALTGLALAQATARVAYTGRLAFAYLTWNLVLAWIPLGLAILLARRAEAPGGGGRRRIELGALAGAWLLFFPNAPYVVTDLVHLRVRPPVPLWYDAALTFNFGLAGLAVGCASLHLVRCLVERRLGPRAGAVVVVLAAVLAGFGTWLGRFRRANSWDLLVDPVRVGLDVAAGLGSPRAFAATLLMGALLLAAYGAFATFAWIEGPPEA